jgi:hypothetical protein
MTRGVRPEGAAASTPLKLRPNCGQCRVVKA